jgi:hypothetical protein
MNGLRVSEEGEVTCRGRAQHCCSDLLSSSLVGLGQIRIEKSPSVSSSDQEFESEVVKRGSPAQVGTLLKQVECPTQDKPLINIGIP